MTLPRAQGCVIKCAKSMNQLHPRVAIMQGYACLVFIVVLWAVHSRSKRRAFHHPGDAAAQLAYGTTRWLLWLTFLWWIVAITPRAADHFVPGHIVTETNASVTGDATTNLLFPPLPSWSDKH